MSRQRRDDAEEREDIGAVVRVLREAKGWSRSELAERTRGSSHPVGEVMIAKVEQGARRPSVRTMRALATAFGVEPERLSAGVVAQQLARNNLSRRAATQVALGLVQPALLGSAAGAVAYRAIEGARRQLLAEALVDRFDQVSEERRMAVAKLLDLSLVDLPLADEAGSAGPGEEHS